MAMKAFTVIVSATLLPLHLSSCALTASVINGKKIQRSRVVDVGGIPVSASIHPGVPAPLMGKFNNTDKNGYFLVNPNFPELTISSDGYESFTSRSDQFPDVVVLRKSRHGHFLSTR